jgi:ABC-type lipoprotein release transport system permease subunit
MNLSLRISFRYLFSKKSHNAINIISIISACGVCVGTIALVCVLSVYNGFESLIKDLFNQFDPDLKITLVEGKSFDISSSELQKVKSMDKVASFTKVLEENALIKYGEKQTPAIIKGVSDNYVNVNHIEDIMYRGTFKLKDKSYSYAVAGVGLASQLNMATNFIDPISIYAPKRTQRINMASPESSFNQQYIYLSGIFSVKQAEYDDKYLIVPIEMAQQLFEYGPNMVTAVELKIAPNVNVDKVQKEIKTILGKNYNVKNRYEQQESFYRIMRVEKWISYLILSFILLIAIFNIIGSLSMLIIEKQSDITTLRNMGASNKQIKSIFLYEGWLISVMGAFVGIVIGAALCLAQEFFGFIKLHGGDNNFIINAYPVDLHMTDLLLIFITVITMGFLAVTYPVKFIKVS